MAKLKKSVTGLLTVALCVVSAGSVAHAQDGWPQYPGEGASEYEKRSFYLEDFTGRAITPDDSRFYDPHQHTPRILSPFGNRNKIMCEKGFRATIGACYQADESGKPHKLIALNNSFREDPWDSTIYVYPELLGPLTQPVFALSSSQ
ncbi:hypothetical protein [Corynebacterium phocae]|uniref:hypothetical protein n=1 Tax=Corynebacterium phocae TaxID=161895 RepID=UPI00123A2D8F|nr:hypothetical protein [Corynebacterium phocae]KAA8728601.1 hypothetical protein F4V58_00280 [Corynebacterium phocae]